MSDESLTWNQIYTCIAKAMGVKLKSVYVSSTYLASHSNYDFTGSLIGDKANTVVFDCSKLKTLVPDFVATKRADQGIRETVAYVLSHPECQKPDPDPDFDKWCDEIIAKLN